MPDGVEQVVAAAVAVVFLTVSYGRPPFVALLIAATWSVYGLLKRQVPLTAIESLAGETFLLLVPAVLVAAIAGAATAQIASERQQVLTELRRDVGGLAVTLASKVVGESLEDEARQRRTVERFLEGLEGTAAAPTATVR